ncbi:MAG: hypothetical protein JWQ07_1072 [Ramlibacter sp.]|nr:hypothetical protein [Ramlibacter sp.]
MSPHKAPLTAAPFYLRRRQRIPAADNQALMDDIVRQAIAKWPNVPHCYGWLGLDARGNWYMRDDRVQAAGPFARNKGSLLRHEKLVDFIQRNYDSDAQGQWFFQNGPQRVYVELELTPLVWRLGARHGVTAHTGQAALPQRCVVDELGRLYLECDLGFGLVHTLDVAQAADAIEEGLWAPEQAASSELPQRFGYVLSPAAQRQVAAP